MLEIEFSCLTAAQHLGIYVGALAGAWFFFAWRKPTSMAWNVVRDTLMKGLQHLSSNFDSFQYLSLVTVSGSSGTARKQQPARGLSILSVKASSIVVSSFNLDIQ